MPILIIHLPPEHRAAIDEHGIRLTRETHGWSVEGTIPGTWCLGLSPSKCGFYPDREEIEDDAITLAVRHGVGEIYVEG
jgi:hypothetical protein